MKNATETVLSALLTRLHEQAKRYHPALESAPTAILWADEKRKWDALIPQLKAALPELFSLGAYSPEERTGPGVWLRIVADRQAGKVGAGVTPILYLPGVGNGQLRADLRGLKDDPHLAPLAEPGRVGKRLYRLPTLNWHNRWASKKTLAHPTWLPGCGQSSFAQDSG